MKKSSAKVSSSTKSQIDQGYTVNGILQTKNRLSKSPKVASHEVMGNLSRQTTLHDNVFRISLEIVAKYN